MAAQPSFISDMQTLSTGCIQQNNSSAQQKQQSQGNKSLQSQAPVSSSQGQQNGQGTNVTTSASQGTVAHSGNVGSQQSAAQQSQQQPQQSVQTPPAVTQFIAVEQDSQSPGNVNIQQSSGVHHAYVHYVDGGSDPGLYAATNGQLAGYSVYSVTDSGTMYTPSSGTYYNTGSGTAVSYSQVGSNVNQGVGIQGQILTHQGGGTYLVQGSPLDGEGHPLSHASRASPATENGAYKVQGTLMDGESHHNLTSTSSAASHATRISPVTEDPRKVTDILSSYSNDQCVIQTLHSSHDNSQLQALPTSQQSQQQQQQQQPQSSHHSQHQNVRDMDIIHVQWLIDNYETAEGVSLPRSTLYNHYLRHCTEHKLEPVNAASFGKLIRSVFLGLRTRRLGTRGNSKYHYYGIRVKPSSPLNQLAEDVSTTALRQQPINQTKRFKSSIPTKAEIHDGNSNTSSTTGSQHAEPAHSSIQPTPQQQQHQQYLGDATAAIPAFVNIDFDSTPLPDGITEKEVEAFRLLYREHCEAFLEAVMNLQFSMVENLWQSFWRAHNNHGDTDKVLGKPKLQILCKCQPVIRFVRRADYQFYQNLVDVLIPDVLRPIPSSLTQAIRNFAKSLEGWLTSAMLGCPDDMVKIKVSAVSAFAQTLRRYTSLNHLAQAARAVLQNSSQINQMLADLNRVDFHNVQEQASWVCQCEDDMVQRLEQDFKLTLQQQNSLEQWAAWLEGVVTMVLQPHEGKPDFPKAARQFLLKWSFYSSMVIRDLTLRSAASFGSFHLIRLLYDEYMFYLIEHRVAKATGETPIAVMGEFIGMGSRLYCSGKDSERLAATLSSASRSVMENGSPEDSCTGLLGGQNSFTVTVSNGLKDSSALTSLQRGLIGQPAVCIGTGATGDGSEPPALHQNKKVKSV